MKKYIFLTITILWTAFIFYNSFKTGLESSEQSNFVVGIVDKFLNIFKIQIEEPKLSLIIRKLAHFFEYFILTILLIITFQEFYNVNLNILKYIIVLIISLLVALSDELLQYFIEGRGSSFIDVIIDFSGSLVAALIIFIFKNKKIKQ